MTVRGKAKGLLCVREGGVFARFERARVEGGGGGEREWLKKVVVSRLSEAEITRRYGCWTAAAGVEKRWPPILSARQAQKLVRCTWYRTDACIWRFLEVTLQYVRCSAPLRRFPCLCPVAKIQQLRGGCHGNHSGACSNCRR